MTRWIERLFVWAGGGLFVGSLLFLAYCYLIRWSVPDRAGFIAFGWPALWFDAALLVPFAMHHSLFARQRVKTWLARAIPERLLRAVYVWIASLLLIGTCALWQPIGRDIYQASGVRRALHVGVQVIGLWLIAQSVRSIDPLELAGIRRRQRTEALQMAGPYRLVRHPLYLGWLLAIGGASHMTADRLAFAVVTVTYLVVAIPLEERSLVAEFGPAYERYKTQVRWRFVPYVY